MAPILKIDPLPNESLDKAKTAEQIAAEIAAKEKFYSERKKRIKSSKKKKVVETSVIEEVQLSFNPLSTTSPEPTTDQLIEQFNELLKTCEDFLQKESKKFKLKKPIKDTAEYKLGLIRPKGSVKFIYESDFVNNTHIPKSIESINGSLNSIPTGLDLFQLEDYKSQYKRNVLVNRLWFNPSDVKYLVKYPKESKKLLLTIFNSLYNELVNIKFLNNSGGKYSGTTVASICIPGQKNKYVINYKDEQLEIRLWSDIT
jgi:hypothetical protein